VIVRAWSARTTPAQAPAYAEHLRGHVLPQLHQLAGYQGALLLNRPASEEQVEILVLTCWASLDAIHAFAGADIETAVVADEAAAVLTTFDDRVRHYDIVLEDHPWPGSAKDTKSPMDWQRGCEAFDRDGKLTAPPG